MKRTHSDSPAPPGNSGSTHKSKKLKLHTSYTTDSPFPSFPRPTPEDALEVHSILVREHPDHPAFRNRPTPGANPAKACGEVPNVIEALIGVILSQNTTAQNYTATKASLDEKFGKRNFAAIASAPRADVVDAIRQGGLANKKAATIQKILTSIEEKHGEYSLQHFTETDEEKRLSDDAIMEELISYDGVGPKTASCVLLFCLGRDSFAVDTHVFRLSKILGWIPDKADRILAQAHLDKRIPGELKYGLHVLMVQHGRICKGCKKLGTTGSCVLKAYVKQRKHVENAIGVDD